MVLRWSFHVYYGPASPWVLVWGAAALALFWWTRRLTPLIVTYAVWDFLGTTSAALGSRGTAIMTLLIYVVILAGELALLGYLARKGIRYLRRRRTAAASAV